jgi:glycerol uptake facilitator protein
MSEFMAEFIGTMLLVLLGDGVVANVCLKGTKGNSGGWIVITMGWGLAVFTAVVVSSEFSGAHLNPAVTVALATAGQFAAAKVPLFLTAQFLGGAAGALLVWLFYKDHFDVSTDPGAEAVALARRAGLRIAEVPVLMLERAHGRSSIDVWRTLYYLVKVSLALVLLPPRPGHASGLDPEAAP